MAGVERASVLSGILSSFVGAEAPASLRLAGMCDLEGERQAHVHWFNDLPLRLGDRLSISLAESDSPTPPAELKPTDSPEYLAEQRAYNEAEATWQPPTERAPRTWSELRFCLSINEEVVVRSGCAASQDHYLCSFDWNQWRPDRLRLYARSFSGAFVRPDYHHTAWLRANLAPGEVASVGIDA